MKNQIGRQLANLLYFYWRVYQRTCERKRKEEEARKKKAKKGKKKKGVKRNDSIQSKTSSFSTPAHTRQKSVATKSDAGQLSKSPGVKAVDRRTSVMVPPKS